VVKTIGLGGVTVDQIGVVDHLPGPDEVLRLQEYRLEQGGMVATALAAVARLGGAAEFIGAVGDDQNGAFALRSFRRAGIRTRRVRVVPGGTSAFSFVIVDSRSGRRSIIHEPGVQRATRLSGATPDLTGAGFLHLDRFWIETAIEAARRAKKQGITVCLDVGHNQADPRIGELLALADYVAPSLAFARRYTGTADPAQAARRLLAPGAGTVIQTLGDRGAFVATARGEEFTVPAFAVQVVDTTGAGDSFHGGLIFALAQGRELREAVRFAAAVAALKCTKLGGQQGLPTLEEVEALLGTQRDRRL
jgi:sulfofructose kinase